MKKHINKIGVVIPTHNRKDNLKTVLDDINKQKTENVIFEVIVIVDGSTDGTIEMLQNYFPAVHIVSGDGNWWFTKCLNMGCRKAQSLGVDYIFTLNDDCYFGEDLVNNLLEAYNKIPPQSAVGAITVIKSTKYRVTFSGTKKFIKWRVKRVPYLDNRVEYNLEELQGIYPTYSLMTRGLLFPIEIGEDINFFDEKNFPQYGSDEDFVLRLIDAGHSAYVSWDAKVFDNPLLSSMGSTITRPNVKQFIKSFFNEHTINYILKTIRFQLRHGYRILMPLFIIYSIFGTTYAYLWKYRKTNI